MTSGSNWRHLNSPQTEEARKSIRPTYHGLPAKLQHFPPSTPPALDLPAGTSARVAWLRSSCEVSKASVGELTNCFSRVDRETGSTRWPRSLPKNNGKSSLFVRSHPKPMGKGEFIH